MQKSQKLHSTVRRGAVTPLYVCGNFFMDSALSVFRRFLKQEAPELVPLFEDRLAQMSQSGHPYDETLNTLILFWTLELSKLDIDTRLLRIRIAQDVQIRQWLQMFQFYVLPALKLFWR